VVKGGITLVPAYLHDGLGLQGEKLESLQ